MSKQSEAKINQGYDPKPLVRSCRNCANLKSERKPDRWSREHPDHQAYFIESLFCGLGGFAVKAQGICNEFKAKPEAKALLENP